MQFESPLLRGRLVRRYKRFLADIELEGRLVVAHCANPGSMKTCLQPGAIAWLSEHDSPKRKLRYTWELTRLGRVTIQVNPLRANALVAEAIQRCRLPELAGYAELRREVKYGLSSRIDLLLSKPGEQCYVEVKNATLSLGEGRCAFPDSVTVRGAKHLEELVRMKQAGHRAVLVFAVARSDARSVEPAEAIDPHYASRLRWAASEGVELLAYGGPIGPKRTLLARALPVKLHT